MKTIILASKQIILIDDEDFPAINQFKWYAVKINNIYYALRRDGLSMHRFLLPTINYIDHKDGNGLNNRRDNLRPCTNSQNLANTKPQEGRASKYKGVSFCKSRPNSPWRAWICVNYKRMYLGSFLTEQEAALHYNIAADHYFGEFAYLNNF